MSSRTSVRLLCRICLFLLVVSMFPASRVSGQEPPDSGPVSAASLPAAEDETDAPAPLQRANIMYLPMLQVMQNPGEDTDGLDHFKCYLAQGTKSMGVTVKLRDQFGSLEARVLDANRFCNPVEKRRTDAAGKEEVTTIGNPDHHFKFYRIEIDKEVPSRVVSVDNQFGEGQKLEVAQPRFLAVPTQKMIPGDHQPPQGLDHFECYEVVGQSADLAVGLRDQFFSDPEVKVITPYLLCNPVAKTHNEQETPIQHKDEHLLCYRIEAKPFQTDVRTRDQFGDEGFAVNEADLLCLPSLTTVVVNEKSVPGEITDANAAAETRATAAALPPIMQGCELSTPDYVVTGSESVVSGDEHCFPSDGAGGFGPRSNIPGLGRVDGMDVADMDGDGDNDFLACDGTSGQVYLYTQGPPLIFTPSVAATAITSGIGGSVFCTNLREADFNGDGLRDFVVGDNRVTSGMSVYLQGPIGSFTPVAGGLDVTWASPDGINCNCLFGVAAGDVNGDSLQDVLVLGYNGPGAGRVIFYKGDGTGGMSAPVTLFSVRADFPIVTAPTGIALFDAEGDGDLDIVVGGSADGSHYVYLNDGAGNFTAPAGPAFDVNNYTGIDAYDFNGDGTDDLVLVDWWAKRLVYIKNTGVGLAAPAGVGTVDGPSIGIGAPRRLGKPTEGLDHFKCYLAEGTKSVDASVKLSDQFGSSDARVLEATRFCNAVEKQRILESGKEEVTPIQNPDHHLKFYRIDTNEEAQPRVVRINNQFVKDQVLEVTKPLFLAVPAQKLIPNQHQPPQGLDHFKCYQAIGKATELTVGLRDQFLSDPEVKVLDPFLLCNPVVKIHNEQETPVQHPDDHLMCYQIEAKSFQTDVRTRDQFGGEDFIVNNANLLCLPTKKTHLVQEPNITQMCGDNSAANFDGGMVLPGGLGTGLLRYNPDLTFPAGRPPRPCGKFIPIDGFLPGSGVTRFRVAYRPAGDPVPPAGTALGVQTKWILYDRSLSPFCQPNAANVLQTDADGWMDVADYLEAKFGGPSTDFCPNSGLRLAVWDSDNDMGFGPADPDGHYVLWLEWDDGSLQKEAYEHHLQLDNTLPVLNDLVITLADGTTPVGACGEAPAGSDTFKVYADFADEHYWGYHIRVRGGNPPATVNYGWHDYQDGTAAVANTDSTGTVPDSTTVFLRNVDMNDFGASFTDCCYLLELFVRDAAIRHSFNNRVANESTGGYWNNISQFLTFAAAP